jgi:hypothetical protein
MHFSIATKWIFFRLVSIVFCLDVTRSHSTSVMILLEVRPSFRDLVGLVSQDMSSLKPRNMVLSLISDVNNARTRTRAERVLLQQVIKSRMPRQMGKRTSRIKRMEDFLKTTNERLTTWHHKDVRRGLSILF